MKVVNDELRRVSDVMQIRRRDEHARLVADDRGDLLRSQRNAAGVSPPTAKRRESRLRFCGCPRNEVHA
jgi:hypothetical protein